MLLIGRRHWSFTLRRYRFLDRFALFKTEARALNNIGIAYYELGELQKALDYLQQSLPLMRAAGNKNSEAYTLLNIGRVYRRSGDQKALTHFSQAQALQQQTGNKAEEAESLDETGIAYSALGQQDKALDYQAELRS